jgi:hypothetical protein
MGLDGSRAALAGDCQQLLSLASVLAWSRLLMTEGLQNQVHGQASRQTGYEWR